MVHKPSCSPSRLWLSTNSVQAVTTRYMGETQWRQAVWSTESEKGLVGQRREGRPFQVRAEAGKVRTGLWEG